MPPLKCTCHSVCCTCMDDEPISMLTVNVPEEEERPDILSLKMPVVITSNQKQNFLLTHHGIYTLINLATGVVLTFATNDDMRKFINTSECYAREAEINIVY